MLSGLKQFACIQLSTVQYMYFYINAKSKHPPSVIKEISRSIGRRIWLCLLTGTSLSTCAAKIYNQALRTSGYSENIQYTENTQASQRRSRKIIWFNPPFSKNVQTNAVQLFLRLVDKHFGYTELSSLFNRKILNSAINTSAKSCNCKKKEHCPLEGACLTRSIVYRSTLTQPSSGDVKTLLHRND